MPPQTLGINEGLGAESAGVGSLPCVNHPVALETGRVFVGLPTVATLVWSDVAMCSDVSVEVGWMSERLVAVWALVGRG